MLRSNAPKVGGCCAASSFHTPSAEQAPVCASTPDLYKQVLQSVESKRPFARARQRVALCLLYLTGCNVSKLLTMEVSHLKQLRDSTDAGEVLRSYTGRFVQGANELVADISPDLNLLIAALPDNSPALRANTNSKRPCARAALTLELNRILGWLCHIETFNSVLNHGAN